MRSSRFGGVDVSADLPEPVARYFTAALGPKAPPTPAAVLAMRGSIKTVAGVIRSSDRYVGGVGGMTWTLFGPSAVSPAAGTQWRATGSESTS